MSLNQPPTAAAMRAAKRLDRSNGALTLSEQAEIIDQETNVRELLEALEKLVEAQDGTWTTGTIKKRTELAKAILKKTGEGK